MAETEHTPQRMERRNTPATGRMQRAETRRKVKSLILAGMTEQEVADTLGITRNRVTRIVTKLLDRYEQRDAEQVERLRKIQLDRLDRITQAVWPRAIGVDPQTGQRRDPDLKAVDRMLKIEQLRARIAGTEAPKRLDISGEIGVTVTREEAEALDAAWAAAGGDIIDGTLVELPPAS